MELSTITHGVDTDIYAPPADRDPEALDEHGVSILDLIFNEGPDAGRYLKTTPRSRAS